MLMQTEIESESWARSQTVQCVILSTQQQAALLNIVWSRTEAKIAIHISLVAKGDCTTP
jgi:hypothetical protein